jgi:hypothetical protein
MVANHDGLHVSEHQTGLGELTVNDERGVCHYDLTRWSGEIERGDGWLKDGHMLLATAANHGLATLRVQDGRLYAAKVLGLAEGVARITFTRSIA